MGANNERPFSGAAKGEPVEQKPSFDKRFALLIDADNVSSKYIKPILDELSKYGTITYKRIYGDWTSTLHAKWKDALLDNSITPIQQFSYTVGKNATDSAMIIDAMDILYTNSVEGFCLVSSDSDFTRLASRIRESGLTVIGMGEKKTPTPFRKACDIFTTLELLIGEARRDKANGSSSSLTIEEVERAVVDIITDNQNNGKSTGLGEVGSRLLKRYPDFDVRSYGTNQLTKLLGEFASVQVIKDGSSVMVELTEVVSVGAEVADTADGKANLQQDTAEKQENEKPKRSRRGRSRRGRAKSAAAETPEQDQQAAVNQGVASEAAAAEQDAPDGEAELAPTSRAQIAPAQDAPELQDAPASIEPAQQTAPVQAEPAQTPESVVFDAVRNAGAEGVSVAELTKRVRATFKDFKVRDRGFSQMRQFVASLGDIKVEKRGSVYFATLEE